MNNKRQTIWLVSMLSLMVILSAYYLFTDDSGTKAPPVAESTQVDGQKPGAGQEANGTAGTGDELVVNEVLEEGTDGDSGANEQGTGTSDTGAAGTENPAEATQGEQGKASGEDGKMEEPEVKESQEGAENSKDASSTGKEGAEESKDTSSTSNGNKSDEEVLEQVAANATSAAAQLESYKLDRSQKI